jgi:hypothetical protein
LGAEISLIEKPFSEKTLLTKVRDVLDSVVRMTPADTDVGSDPMRPSK